MSSGSGVFVFGASGHAKVVIDAIEQRGQHEILYVCDDAPGKRGTRLMGYPVVGGRSEALARRSDAHGAIVSIGENAARCEVARWLLENGWALLTVVHPAATIAREVQIERGTVVMAGCVINSGTRVGANVIINTGATVDHDCVIEDGVHVAPGSHVCGNVAIGPRTLIGAGTVVIPGIRVGSNAIIGAGSTVLSDIPDDARVGGTPCRPLA